MKDKIKVFFNNKFFGNLWVRLGFIAFFINLFIEILSRMSLISTFKHLFTAPLVFLYNTLLIFMTLTITAFFRKRLFVGALISAIWVILGIVNGIISSCRKTPFTAQDFRNTAEGLKIMNRYISIPVIILIGLAAVGLVVGIVFLGIKSRKYEGRLTPVKSAVIFAVSLGLTVGMTVIGHNTGLLALNFGNIRQAYRDYGFGYCFTSSLINTGVKKPKDYSPEKVDDIISDINQTAAQQPSDGPAPTEETTPDETVAPVMPWEEPKSKLEHPNIIFVQLESLFDATLVKELEFSEDPIPNLRNLYKNYSSGYFSVPSFGAGTANTEFEVMTGMNLDDFGPGEYPYKTVLKDRVCESVCYDLKEYGYNTNVLHNNSGDFYQRNLVFGNLGYDSFTSLEYMNDFDKTPAGWVKDEALIDEIFGILKTSAEQDFIYTISVEGHGDYPSETEEYDFTVKVTNDEVTGAPESFEYYVNMIHNMDIFVRNLVFALENYDEDTVVVFYGDHLPTFEIEDEDMKNNSIFQTNYVIWSNFDIEKRDADIEAYQLSSLVLSRLGLSGSIISQCHQAYMENDTDEDEEEYLANLKMLEYDILYGDCEAFDGEIPFEPTVLKMGYKVIAITDLSTEDDTVIVDGENFTWASKIFINGKSKEKNTVFESENRLILEKGKLKDGDIVTVRQVTNDGVELSRTAEFVYHE